WPTWSPDGKWIAFSRLLATRSGLSSAGVALVSADAGQERTIALPPQGIPIYITWSPDGHFVSVLVQLGESLQLQLADASLDSPSLQPAIEAGAPLFTSWSPDSGTLLVHVNGDRRSQPRARLSQVNVKAGSDPEILALQPGMFQTPAWSPD